VGAGKSSLMHALLGEMHIMKGKLIKNGDFAFIP